MKVLRRKNVVAFVMRGLDAQLKRNKTNLKLSSFKFTVRQNTNGSEKKISPVEFVKKENKT
jgi:hypothetical protein